MESLFTIYLFKQKEKSEESASDEKNKSIETAKHNPNLVKTALKISKIIENKQSINRRSDDTSLTVDDIKQVEEKLTTDNSENSFPTDINAIPTVSKDNLSENSPTQTSEEDKKSVTKHFSPIIIAKDKLSGDKIASHKVIKINLGGQTSSGSDSNEQKHSHLSNKPVHPPQHQVDLSLSTRVRKRPALDLSKIDEPDVLLSLLLNLRSDE